MRRLPVARLLSVASLVGAGVVWFAPYASADAPTREGWWAKWQQPTEVVDITLPVTVPSPPTADPHGLTIARDVTDVQAVAAVYFQLEVGTDATLYLDTADGREPALPPDADVKACEATSDWEAELHGPWSNAPTWGDDCFSGVRNEAQEGFIFDLPASMQDNEGAYSVVIVPGGSAPYTVSFATTDDGTVVPGTPPPTSSTTTTTEPEETTTTTTEPVVEETDPIVYTDIPPASGSSAFPVVTTAVPPPRTPTSLVVFDPPDLPRALIPDSRTERIMAVSLLFFMALALWWLGGAPQRMPRLIGALAGEGRAVSPPPVPARGVGRFARPRDAMRPPRL